ncbi:MAG: PASTA domain-containing protein, partial [Acidimicrobiia bacterium]
MRGWVRDELVRADGTVERSPWRPNLVVRGGLDLVAALLCEHEGARGLGWLAVGTGDGTWDATPPPRDPARRALTAEVARVALQPGTRQLSYDEDGGRVVVRATFGRGVATGTLRETGLFGGARASILAGSGVLVNHQAHGPIDKGPDDVLHRDVALVLGDDLGPGARALVGRLLARRPGTRGLTHLALGTGTDADPGPDALVEERWRGRLDRRGVRYDAATATVVVRARVDPAEVLATWPQGEPDADGRRAPLPVREVGLLGGDARDGGILVARTAVDLPPPDDPRPIEHTARLVLSARTDVVVPDLSGQALDEARAALGADLLLGEVVERVVVGVSGGTVEAQAPPP